MSDTASGFRVPPSLRGFLSIALLPVQLVVVMHLLLAASGLAIWKMVSLHRAHRACRAGPVPAPARVTPVRQR